MHVPSVIMSLSERSEHENSLLLHQPLGRASSPDVSLAYYRCAKDDVVQHPSLAQVASEQS